VDTTTDLVLEYYKEHGQVPDIQFFLDLKSEENNSRAFGCHCDLDLYEEPDGCCIDVGRPDDCIYSGGSQFAISNKSLCKYWREKTGYRVSIIRWWRDGAARRVMDELTGWEEHRISQFLNGKSTIYVERNKIEEFSDKLSQYCELKITEI
jgi:hypothetical protein